MGGRIRRRRKKLIDFLIKEMGVKKIRFPETSGIGIKPVSSEGTERLVRKAIQYAIDNDRKSVTLVHKGNIMKFTEGGFRDWGYALAQREFGAQPIDGGPWCKFKNPKTGRDIVVKDVIADAFLQQILLRPGRIRRHRDAQPQRRLHLRRAGRAGRRHRHRAGRQHVGHGRDVRGDARHRAEVRRQGLRQSRLGNPFRRDDAGPHGLEGSRATLIVGRASRRRSPTRL